MFARKERKVSTNSRPKQTERDYLQGSEFRVPPELSVVHPENEHPTAVKLAPKT